MNSTALENGRHSAARRLFNRTILLLPAVILMLVFFVFPVILTVVYSLTNLTLTGADTQNTVFVGLKNYIQLFRDPDVWIAIVNTLVFLVGSSVIGQQVLGFILALLNRNRNKFFRRIVGTCVLAGWVMPEIVAAICLSSFFEDSGTLNQVLGFFGVGKILWLYKYAMLAIVLANIWRGTAFSMLIFQSALDNVSKSVVEAAIIDGANKFQTMVRIILPIIKNTIMTNMTLNTLQTLGVFGLIYAMTGGGPGKDTTTLPILMYQKAFVGYQLGYGTAISMILLGIGVLLSLMYVRFMKADI
jgi:multiple sugar transport system permease protein